MAGTGNLMQADKNVAWYLLDGKPSTPGALKVEDLTGATNIACNVFLADTYLGATASDQVTDPLLCGGANVAFGKSNYEGQMSAARFYDEDGVPDAASDVLWDAAKAKGTTLYIAIRRGPKWDADAATGQEVSLYEVITDNPQTPQSMEGYIKAVIPLGVQQAWEHQVLSA